MARAGQTATHLAHATQNSSCTIAVSVSSRAPVRHTSLQQPQPTHNPASMVIAINVHSLHTRCHCISALQPRSPVLQHIAERYFPAGYFFIHVGPLTLNLFAMLQNRIPHDFG